MTDRRRSKEKRRVATKIQGNIFGETPTIIVEAFEKRAGVLSWRRACSEVRKECGRAADGKSIFSSGDPAGKSAIVGGEKRS